MFFYEKRDSGGSLGIYPPVLQGPNGPNGPVGMPQKLQKMDEWCSTAQAARQD
jgi:hypothetical protein